MQDWPKVLLSAGVGAACSPGRNILARLFAGGPTAGQFVPALAILSLLFGTGCGNGSDDPLPVAKTAVPLLAEVGCADVSQPIDDSGPYSLSGLGAQCALEVAPRASEGDPIVLNINISISNKAQDDLRILKWATPLETDGSTSLVVGSEKGSAEYVGKLVRRRAPREEDFLVVHAGETVSRQYDISQNYFFRFDGDYTVSLIKGWFEVAVGNEPLVFARHDCGTVRFSLATVPSKQPLAKAVAAPMSSNGNCSLGAKRRIDAAIAEAKESVNHGITKQHMSSNDIFFQRWFGQTSTWSSTIQSNLDQIQSAFNNDAMIYDCSPSSSDCDNVEAYVMPPDPTVHLCDYFFADENRWRFATLVHEASHLYANTLDLFAGSYADLIGFARQDPTSAAQNAESYAWFSGEMYLGPVAAVKVVTLDLVTEVASPEIDAISGPTTANMGASYSLVVSAHASDGQALSFLWTASGGTLLNPTSAQTEWTPPNTPGTYTVSATVSGEGGASSRSLQVTVPNPPPRIDTCSAPPPTAMLGTRYSLSVSAHDPDGQPLSYFWEVDGHNWATSAQTWWTPSVPGSHTITVTVADASESTSQTFQVSVVDPTPRHVPVPPAVCLALAATIGVSGMRSAGRKRKDAKAKTVN